jgi:excisionase family DNA binding protein
MPAPRPKPRPPHRRYESIPDAAARAGVTTRSIRRWIASGDLSAYRIGRRMIRLDADELDRRMQAIPTA